MGSNVSCGIGRTDQLVILAAFGVILAHAPPALSAPSECKGKVVSSEFVYIYELTGRGEGESLKTNELSVHGAQLCKVGDKIELFNKNPVTSGQLGFFCDSEKTVDADLWAVDLQKEKTLPPAFLGFALKRCRKGKEAKIQASWIPHVGAAPHPAHEISYEQDGDINESYFKSWTSLALAVPAKEKLSRYITAFEAYTKNKASSGNGWIAGFWSRCYQEQIAAAQAGSTIGDTWMPKAGTNFSADDGLFKIAGVISQAPLRLLIEGPAQADSAIANRCYAVLTLKNKSQLLTTQAPTPGYEVKLGDQIHGFSVRSKGKVSVQMKTIRSLASEAKVLPEFELIGKIPMAQRP